MSRTSERLNSLPQYVVAEIAAVKSRLLDQGVDVIDVAAGDADFAPPHLAVETLREALSDSSLSRYSYQVGLRQFRDSIAAYMLRRFGVTVDPMSEVLPLIGSKEGLAHFVLAVVNPGEVVVIPDPGYPAYLGGARFADADIEMYPLKPEQDFLVELGTLPKERLSKTSLVFANYPNNPTAAVANRNYLNDLVRNCVDNRVALAYDNPYCELTYDDYTAPSVLEIDGAREVTVEFHSFSKSFGMTGWRLGWAVGNADLINALARTKSYMDTGPFLAIQKTGAVVLDHSEACVEPVRRAFRERRDSLVAAMAESGFPIDRPRASMYAWVPLPAGVKSAAFAKSLLERTGVAVLAGSALGSGGEGFFRIALTVGAERLREAARRICSELKQAEA